MNNAMITVILPEIVDPEYSLLTIGDLDVTLLYTCGIKRDDYSDVHFHSCFEIQYITDGVMMLETEERIYEVKKGEVIIIPPYASHQNAENEHHYGRFSMNMILGRNQKNDKKEFSEFVYYSDLFRHIDSVQHITNKDISGFFEKYLRYDNTPGMKHLKELYLSIIFIRIAESLSETIPEYNRTYETEKQHLSLDDRKRAFMIEQYVVLNYMNVNACNELKELLHLSRRQTDRIVRTVTGSSLYQLIEKYRMKTAGLLTSQTDRAFNRIAEDCGYSSYVGFYNAFRRFYGYSPEKYREMKRNSLKRR